jgi:hypothetical protein
MGKNNQTDFSLRIYFLLLKAKPPKANSKIVAGSGISRNEVVTPL